MLRKKTVLDNIFLQGEIVFYTFILLLIVENETVG